MNYLLRNYDRSVPAHKRPLALLCFCLILLFFPVGAVAQDVGGSISGTIRDAQGAVIPNTEVSIRNTDTGVVTTLQANEQGVFTVPSLHGGNYEVTAKHQGFKETVQRGVVLQIGGSVGLDIRLDVGAVSETVNVTGEPPAMEISNASLGTVVEQRQIAELPLNGRNALALVMLARGVRSFNPSNQSGFADRGSALSNISINGSPSGMNGNLLDGANNLQSYTGELSINPTVDAIQEFKRVIGHALGRVWLYPQAVW